MLIFAASFVLFPTTSALIFFIVMGAYYKSEVQNQPLESPTTPPLRRRPSKLPLLLAVAVLLKIIVAALTWADVIEWTDGKPQLKPKREAQLQKELREIDEAEQYALVAAIPGFYPCPLCPSKMFFLNAGEVWKYGVTRKEQKGRYSEQFLLTNNLLYVTEFVGNYAQCLAIEKIKLYKYPLLQENLIRPDSLKLLLPPGNQQTK